MKNKRLNKKIDNISNNTTSSKKSNIDNPKIGREFEVLVQSALENKFKISFSSRPIKIGNPPKLHFFDLVSEDGNIIAECKSYSWTKSGNVPSAKLATLNEAVLYLLKAPRNTKKIIVLKKDYHKVKKETLAEYYSRTYVHLLENIHVMELDTDKMLLTNVKGDI